MHMSLDFERSRERVERQEEKRAEKLGAGLTMQGQAVVDRYLAPLTDLITADFKDRRRNRAVRSALTPMKPDGVAFRLLVAGVTLSLGDRYGVDENGDKTKIDQALWIGDNFGLWGEPGYRVGAWGLALLCRLDRFKMVDGRLCLVDVTGDLEPLLSATIINAAEHNPLLKPLGYEPTPWTGFRAGGLSKNHWAKVQLVRTQYKTTEDIFRKALGGNGPLRTVLDGLNYLQATPFTINQPILDLVIREGAPPPPSNEEVKRRLAKRGRKSKKALLSEIEREHRNQVEEWQLDKALAEATAVHPRCYVPLNFDFRGRLNPICGLSVYRSDRVRALFRFADGEIITAEGVRWLKQFVARLADGNTFSDEPKPSRLDLDGRIAWTNKYLAWLVDIGSTVLSGGTPQLMIDGKTIDPLQGIDDCFQFAAACAELAGVIEAYGDGTDFITRLPIQFDASCSGLQHLCAMSGAPEGKYVNLAPAPLRTFFVEKHIAAQAEDDLRLALVTKPDDAVDIYTLIARELSLIDPVFGDLPENLQRKICKAPIMTMVYGAGVNRQAKQIKEIWPGANAKALAKSIRGVLKEIAPIAMAAFEWIEKIAELCSEHKKVLRWTTPLGFPVINDYRWSITKQIRTPTANPKFFQKTRFAIGHSDRLKGHKAEIALAANFIHSADACLLQDVALACLIKAIPLITIHDCFMTLANHAARLKQLLAVRLDIIHQFDWLDELHRAAREALPKTVDVPPPPSRGALAFAVNFHTFS
jgi:DNA-directed RNA polymerase